MIVSSSAWRVRVREDLQYYDCTYRTVYTSTYTVQCIALYVCVYAYKGRLNVFFCLSNISQKCQFKDCH